MINKFEHLSNGLTLIYCLNTKEEREEKVYFDTDMFNYINAFNVEWKIWDDSGKKTEKIVGGINLKTDKILNLKRLIGEYLFGVEFNFTLLNGNYIDHRKCNVFNFSPGTGHSGKTKSIKEKKLSNMDTLQKKEDIDILQNNNVQVVEYNEKVLIVDNHVVVNEIPFKYLDAIKSYTLS